MLDKKDSHKVWADSLGLSNDEYEALVRGIISEFETGAGKNHIAHFNTITGTPQDLEKAVEDFAQKMLVHMGAESMRLCYDGNVFIAKKEKDIDIN